jgi:hypothetical protein
VKWRPIIIAGLAVAVVAGLVIWLQHARLVGHWVEVHTGTVNEPGPYYGFWSGFGSDLEEFGTLGAVGAGIYSLVRKYNCHEPGCWRIGNHPAGGRPVQPLLPPPPGLSGQEAHSRGHRALAP